ncbi:MAG: GNAT family N-acetyltransferase [Alphaproteobacteria bacterium]|nr:GNAT family N-acetyltransferase [Alphaproteobacteria bacterium]
MSLRDELTFRDARPEDLAAVLFHLDDDSSNARRTAPPDPSDPGHIAALAEVTADPNNRVVVVERQGVVIGTFQLTVIPGVSLKARRRLQVEAVRVRADNRGLGIGRIMMEWASAYGRERECVLIQLTTDRSRDGRARAFYESLGFKASHDGMKMRLDR